MPCFVSNSIESQCDACVIDWKWTHAQIVKYTTDHRGSYDLFISCFLHDLVRGDDSKEHVLVFMWGRFLSLRMYNWECTGCKLMG